MKSNFSKIVILLEILLVGYLIYALTKNVYQNYKVDKIIESYRLENQKIEDLIQNKTEEYLYVTSEEYIDKIAKQNLGFVNPGEEIIVLSSDVLSEGLSDDKFFSGKDVKESVPMQWKNVFFDD
jgi:cell division protein FtsB